MIALVVVLFVLLAAAVVGMVLCVLACRGAFARADEAQAALVVEEGIVAVQREEIAELAQRLIDARAGWWLDEIRVDTFGPEDAS